MAKEENSKLAIDGRAMAVALWLIVIVSVAYFFKWGTPELASDRTAQDTLFHVILGITGTAYVVVQSLLALYLWRYRDRSDAEASYWHENHKLEMTWTVGTAVVLIPIVLFGLRLWNRVYAAPPPDAFEVEVVGAQFQWDMRYPGPDGRFGRVDPALISLENPLGIDPNDPASTDDFVLTNQLVLPVDRPALIHLRSKDVQHSFFLPNFRVKQDLVPGMNIQTWFVPKKVGQYEIACAELCGLGHYRMRGFLEVKGKDDFDRWWREQTGGGAAE